MKPYLLLVAFQILVTCVFGQASTQNKERSALNEERYQKALDSLNKLHPFVPAVSSVVLQNNQVELNFFSSIITANEYRDQNGNLKDLGARHTYFYNNLQITYGLFKQAKLNIGLDINSIFGRIDQDRNSSLFAVFKSHREPSNQSAKALSSIGPRIRWKPFNSHKFTIQNSLLFPILNSSEKKAVLGQNQIYLQNQLLYNQLLSKSVFLFAQFGLQYGFKTEIVPAMIVSPVSGYLGFILPKNTVVFTLANYIPVFRKVDKWDYSAYTMQVGGGIQHSFSKAVLVNLYYTNDVKGKTYQDFSSYNIGFRFIFN